MIFCILGKSASGKSTFQKRVLEDKSIKISQLKSYTTRPKRNKGEKEYIYLNDREFEIIRNNLVGVTEYSVASKEIWKYAMINKEDIKDNYNYIIVVNPTAYREIKTKYKDRAVGLYIDVSDKERIIRSLRREENPNVDEIYRRLNADNIDFAGIKEEVKYTLINDDNNFNKMLYEIKRIIHKEINLRNDRRRKKHKKEKIKNKRR